MFASLVASVMVMGSLLVSMPPASAATSPAWTASWAIAMASNFGQVAYDATVRQVAPLSVGGTRVRAQFSNQYGDVPLTITAATVALAGAGPAVAPGTVHPLTFGASASVTIPVGATAYSDAVAMVVHAGQSLAISAYVPGRDLVTEHYDAGAGISYASAEGGGNLTADVTGAGLAFPQTWDRWVSAVDVAGGATPPHTTVVLGDSISDGYNHRCPGLQNLCTLTTPWPSVLASRLDTLPTPGRVGVVNEAITANTLIPLPDDDSHIGGGLPGVSRFAEDVLAQPGVDRAFVLLGTNDLWFGASAAQVIAGYRQILAEANAAGVIVIGSTVLPRSTGPGEVWTPAMEENREAVNHWIRTSGAFPVVIDLAQVIGDVYDGACQPNRMFPPYDSGDNLHPDTAGQIAMADAIPTTLLGAGPAPAAAPLVTAIPTSGCPRHQIVALNAPPVGTTTTTTTTTTATTTTTTTTVPSAGRGSSTGTPLVAASDPAPAGRGLSSRLIVALGAAAMALALVAFAVTYRRRARRTSNRLHAQ